MHTINLTINGIETERTVEPRLLLSDFLRHELQLTGTHVGCDTAQCGACTVHLDGRAVKSCSMLAVQADGHAITTVEGLTPEWSSASAPTEMHPVQVAFWEKHGLQCGYCTPGFIMTLIPFLEENPDPSDAEIRDALSGNICRCTGYQNIVAAVKLAAARLRAEEGSEHGPG